MHGLSGLVKLNNEGERDMFVRSLWLAAALVCVLTPDNPMAAVTGGGNESPTAWFVELKSPPSI